MNSLPLALDAVVLDLDVDSAEAVLAELARLLSQQSGAPADAVRQALQEREQQGSTAIGHGVAVPHARSAEVREPVAAALRSRHPVAFAAPDGGAVQIFIALLVPADATTGHLEILSDLASRLMREDLREAVRTVPEAASFHRLLVDARG
ncbi:MAG: PTS sugar transporter subunit IIA [Acidithiobacillus sp.]